MARHRMVPSHSRETLIWEGSRATARRSVFAPRRALLFPLRVGPLQQILGPRRTQMRAAILHYHLAIDVAGLVRNQEAREVRKLAMLAGTAERIARGPALVAALGAKLARRARRGKCAGRDRHGAHALRSPFDGEA